MFACSLLLALLPLAPLGSPSAASPQAVPGYETVWRANAASWIDFVQVETEVPVLRVAVYARDRALGIWIPGQPATPVNTVLLERNERFVHSIHRRTLASLRYDYECLDVAIPGLTKWTEFTFREPIVFPRPEPPPLPPHPPPIEWARQVVISDDGSLLAYARTGGSGSQPTEVVLLALSGAGDREWTAVGTYLHPVQGEMQVSRDGARIAHATRGGVRLYDRAGRQLGPEMAAAAGFRLSPSGDCIAKRESRAVVFTTLGARGVPGITQTVPVPSLPLDVQFAGDRAVIRARDHLLLVEWRSGAVAWERPAALGTYSSVSVAPLAPGRLVVVVGRLEVLQPPARVDGVHVDGLAVAHVEILDASGQPLVAAQAFPTAQWERSSPRVQVLPQARRVLVHTRDLVLASDPLP